MILRNHSVFGREIADRFPFGNFEFARTAVGGHADCGASPYSKHCAPICQNRYPSPSLRPGPSGVRPLLSEGPVRTGRQPAADCAFSRRFHFRAPADRIKCGRITNLAEGRAVCGSPNPSLRWPLSARLPGASITMPNAGWPAQPAERSLLTRLAEMPLPAPLSAVLAASSATISASAANHLTARPTGRLTDRNQTIAASSRGGFFVYAPAARRLSHPEGQRCSRKS